MRFGAFLVFAALWSVLVYAVLAHWVWGGGWLARRRACSTSPAASRSRWRRASRRWPRRSWSVRARTTAAQALLPHNAMYVLLGAGLLWFGWFGFNGGSGFSAGNAGVLAFVEHAAHAGGAR